MQLLCAQLNNLAASLPVMGLNISEVGDYLRGTEFRSLISELIVQTLSGIVQAILYIVAQTFFSGLGA